MEERVEPYREATIGFLRRIKALERLAARESGRANRAENLAADLQARPNEACEKLPTQEVLAEMEAGLAKVAAAMRANIVEARAEIAEARMDVSPSVLLLTAEG